MATDTQPLSGYAQRALELANEIHENEPDLALLGRLTGIVANVQAVLPGVVAEMERLARENKEYSESVARVVADRVYAATSRLGEARARMAAMEKILDSNVRTAHITTPGSVCFCWRCTVDRAGHQAMTQESQPPKGPSIRVGATGTLHLIGDTNCRKCTDGHPFTHKGCGGLIHASYGVGEEMPDGESWIYTICDVCGQNG